MPKNLLLADDSITIQKVVGIAFAGEDFRITAVDNGEEAIARAREQRPDIVLADVVMPRKSGYEVCEAIKADAELRRIPVLLLAGTFEAFDEARARAVRADGHIAKPFESQALVNKVNELLGHGDAAAPPAPPAPARAVAVDHPVPPAPAPGMAIVPPAPPALAREMAIVLPTMPPPAEVATAPALPAPPATAPEIGEVGLDDLDLGDLDLREVPPEPTVPPPLVRPAAAVGSTPAPAAGAVAPPAPVLELLPFGEPIDLTDLQVEEEPAAAGGRVEAPHDGGEALLREALSRASREVVERIAWEIIPPLAETIIREQVERLVRERER